MFLSMSSGRSGLQLYAFRRGAGFPAWIRGDCIGLFPPELRRKRKREKRRTFIHWWREREGEREREIRTVRFGKTGSSKIDQKFYRKIYR